MYKRSGLTVKKKKRFFTVAAIVYFGVLALPKCVKYVWYLFQLVGVYCYIQGQSSEGHPKL